MTQRQDETDLELARGVLRAESEALRVLAGRLDGSFDRAVQALLGCAGRVIVCGIGKAGLVGRKIAATLASTGAPAFFLHPAEACHGDLGCVVRGDVVLILSNSGETDEINRLVPSFRKSGAVLVALTRSADSTLARACDVAVALGDTPEADPLGLAPTSSTTALLALGDALALCLHRRKGFTRDQYAAFHPGGDLGRQFLRVREVMRTGDRNPVVREDAPIQDVLLAITRARAGAASVADAGGRLAGFFTDGDLRRFLQAGGERNLVSPVRSAMTRRPITIGADRYAAEAAALLREKKIDELPVVDGEGRPIGMLDVQDLLDAGLV
jgi:arabinose-5-phosphate isomerase